MEQKFQFVSFAADAIAVLAREGFITKAEASRITDRICERAVKAGVILDILETLK